jgi:hypothetical protein
MKSNDKLVQNSVKETHRTSGKIIFSAKVTALQSVTRMHPMDFIYDTQINAIRTVFVTLHPLGELLNVENCTRITKRVRTVRVCCILHTSRSGHVMLILEG